MPAPAPSIPATLRPTLEMTLGSSIERSRRLAGGDINDVFHLYTPKGDFVVKVMKVMTGVKVMRVAQPIQSGQTDGRQQHDLPHLFFAEAQGLDLLRQADALPVPQVISYGEGPGGVPYLLMTYLQPAAETPQAHEALGRGLAALHQRTAELFGNTLSNFMGALPQDNPPCATAAEFFWQARLEPQLKLAAPQLTAQDLRHFEALQAQLTNVIPAEQASLVHGDLWSGNVLYSVNGPALVDPAATFNHREVDLSMLRLFGRIPQRVFDAYAEVHAPAPGWEVRANLWNLYPLLVHLNLFGETYLPRVRAALHEAVKVSG